MILKKLLLTTSIDINNIKNKSLLNVKIKDITTNSKLVVKNSIFIAIEGYTTDGHLFVEEALNNGALIAVANLKSKELLNQILNKEQIDNVLFVDNTRSTESLFCSIFYTPLPNTIIGVTGTNGKTSVASFVCQILKHLKINNASIGTLGTYFNEEKQQIHKGLTTPENSTLFKILYTAKNKNINNVILEASSEGMEQGRLDCIPINIAAFTNLTQDHLNFHKTFDNYFKAKSKLFTKVLVKDGFAVVNQDSNYGKDLIDICNKCNIKVLTYGTGKATIQLVKVHIKKLIYEVEFIYSDKLYKYTFNTLGDFQVYNLLCALLIVVCLNISSTDKIFNVIPKLQSIDGRLELVRKYQGAIIFVDYAHTPDGLKNVLNTLKKLEHKRIYILFGCGGNRDVGKRKVMGEIACNIADFSYVTDDNPRYESAAEIRKNIISGYSKNNYMEIENRAKAIQYAMKNLENKDILLITGRGRDTDYIEKGNITFHSDIETVLKVT